MTRADDQPRDGFRHAGFTRFWTAQTVSEFGSYITTIALQVLVVVTLHGSAADVGSLNASRWLPYLLLGLIVGALVDRRRRQPILVVRPWPGLSARGRHRLPPDPMDRRRWSWRRSRSPWLPRRSEPHDTGIDLLNAAKCFTRRIRCLHVPLAWCCLASRTGTAAAARTLARAGTRRLRRRHRHPSALAMAPHDQ